MEGWDEIRTAYQVARIGTVSGAAEVLGVHHATVIRHIDGLEGRLAVKLFQRHARGYTPTEAGKDLLRVASATEDQFNQLVGRMKGRGTDVSGELVVTSLSTLAPQIVPFLAAFQRAHPAVIVRLLTSSRVFRLEYGEAHVAIRASAKAPDQPDYVVQHLAVQSYGAYASAAYVAEHGVPQASSEYADHAFVGLDDKDNRAPFAQWMLHNLPRSAVHFRVTDASAMEEALRCGVGIGFLSVAQAKKDPDLVEILPARPEWDVPFWLVTHVDLHRTSKVRALTAFIKDYVAAHPI